MSRRLSLLLACGIGQVFTAAGSVGAPGLDRFGRVADLEYIGATAPLPGMSAGTVHRYEYRYDASGNRTHARVQQAPPDWNGGGDGDGSDRSWAYGYDALQRLIVADRGTATAGGPGDPISLATTDVATEWNLDNLGNWTGAFEPGNPPTEIPGMTITYAPGTANEIVDSRSHAVFFDNSLESVKTQHGTANPVETAYIVNVVGSTVFDGVYYYEYDAWNRLIRVSDAGTVTAASFDARGVLLPPAPPPSGSGPDANVPGDWRLRYTYDGLGRLARKETPIATGSTEARREDYRYDGVRRIQEAVTRWSGAVVVPGGEEQGASGGTNPGEPGEGDPGAVTYGGLEEPVEATELEPFGEGTLLLALPEEWDQREYVWGPDYVDELAFQFDRDGRPLYALLDANYNVMAIIAGGVRPCGNIDADPYDDTVPAGTVLEQYVWSPYGELLALDLLIPPAKGESPRNRAGHQGLFFERFDGLNTDPPLVATDPITGEGKGWYYNRNRWYDATMGRFTTADPVRTELVLSTAMSCEASQPIPELSSMIDVEQYYGGSLNLFGYVGCSPIVRGDASGLDWHHLYPLYLGGSADGAAIYLPHSNHMKFHKTLRDLLGNGTYAAQRKVWKGLPDAVRREYLQMAAEAAGVDIDDPDFQNLLDDTYAKGKHGKNIRRKYIPMANRFDVRMKSRLGPRAYVNAKIPGSNGSRAMAKGAAVAGGVLASAQLLVVFDSNNSAIRALGLATVRARSRTGGLTLSDEAFGLMDMYELTGDPTSAGFAWTMWVDSLNE